MWFLQGCLHSKPLQPAATYLPERASERAAEPAPPRRCGLVCGAHSAAHKRPRTEQRESTEPDARGFLVDSGESMSRKGGYAGPGGKIDAPKLSAGPGGEIQEVSRVGAQGVTSKSKLLAREMPDLHTGGLRAHSGRRFCAFCALETTRTANRTSGG